MGVDVIIEVEGTLRVAGIEDGVGDTHFYFPGESKVFF